MNIKLTANITDIDRTTSVGNAKALIASALYKVPPQTQDGGDAYKQYKLADRIESSGEATVLQAEEIVTIKYVISKMYIPLIIGQLYDILEGNKE